jgi:hypothetical protein
VVVAFVQGVASDPENVAFSRLRAVVDARSAELVGRKVLEEVSEKYRR